MGCILRLRYLCRLLLVRCKMEACNRPCKQRLRVKRRFYGDSDTPACNYRLSPEASPHLVGAQFYERRVREYFCVFSGCFMDAVGTVEEWAMCRCSYQIPHPHHTHTPHQWPRSKIDPPGVLHTFLNPRPSHTP